MLSRKVFIMSGIVVPFMVYIVTTLSYAYGGYDGTNCAGLLDATWSCSELEYYIEWLFNPFTLVALAGYLCISAVVTSLVWLIYKKYNKAKHYAR